MITERNTANQPLRNQGTDFEVFLKALVPLAKLAGKHGVGNEIWRRMIEPDGLGPVAISPAPHAMVLGRSARNYTNQELAHTAYKTLCDLSEEYPSMKEIIRRIESRGFRPYKFLKGCL